MSRCLREETLLLLYEGEGTGTERAHLDECAACTKRYQQLVHDLKLIGQVLQEAPPRSAIAQPRRVSALRWVARVAAVAAMLAVIWVGMWLREPLQLLLFPGKDDQEIVRFLEEDLFPALFATTEIGLGTLPARATNEAYLQAALDGGWPCERREPSDSSKCETDAFSLFLQGQGN